MDKFSELKARLLELTHLSSSTALLHWDLETYMPPRAAAHRAKIISTLATVVHEKLTSPEFEKLITKLKDLSEAGKLSGEEKCVVRETWRDFSREKKLPKEFVRKLARTVSEAHHIWVEARRKSDFGMFRPQLEKLVALKRQQASFLGYGKSPYDALLDIYEPNAKAEDLSLVFAELKDFLVPFKKKIVNSSIEIDPGVLQGDFDIDKQKKFGREVVLKMGYDLESGRIDESVHPFTQEFSPGDVRITTRFDKNNLFYSLLSTIHEAGHALYEQGLREEHFGTPLGESLSLGIHESQSRLWENFVGRSLPFWEHWYPRLQEIFPEPFSGIPLRNFYEAINAVRPSLIRTEADEVTYNLHIIVRFEIEKELIEGALEVKDLPEVWNQKIRDYLGLAVPDDARGVLQDVHWSGGSFGYFPTYTLGNLYAAQFYDAAKKQILNLEEEISRGRFEHLLEWLRKNIHVHGRFYFQDELAMNATGEKLNSRHFTDYLSKKYGEIYSLK